jgi:hypothetical protein
LNFTSLPSDQTFSISLIFFLIDFEKAGVSKAPDAPPQPVSSFNCLCSL